MMALCKLNAMDVCSVCSLPAELLRTLQACMDAAFPGREMRFLCFEKPMQFRPADRTLYAPRTRETHTTESK